MRSNVAASAPVRPLRLARGLLEHYGLDRPPASPKISSYECRQDLNHSAAMIAIRAAIARDLGARCRVTEKQPNASAVGMHAVAAAAARRGAVPIDAQPPLVVFQIVDIFRDHRPALRAGRIRSAQAGFGFRRRRSMVGHGELHVLQREASHLLRSLARASALNTSRRACSPASPSRPTWAPTRRSH